MNDRDIGSPTPSTGHAAGGASRLEPADRVKLQLDYAWKWFDFHGKQRITLFNVFVIMVGVLVNAYVVAVRERALELALAVSLFGVVTALAFIVFDSRNRELTRHAEDVLEDLEREDLFPEATSGRRAGLLLAERRLGMREGVRRTLWQSLHKMKSWMWAMEGLTLIVCLLGVCYSWRLMQRASGDCVGDLLWWG